MGSVQPEGSEETPNNADKEIDEEEDEEQEDEEPYDSSQEDDEDATERNGDSPSEGRDYQETPATEGLQAEARNSAKRLKQAVSAMDMTEFNN